MIKAQSSYARCEIVFWDLLFWLMKALQRIRDIWIKMTSHLTPSLKFNLVLLFCACSLGLILGFSAGYWKAYLGR
jgi:hypothetical protein